MDDGEGFTEARDFLRAHALDRVPHSAGDLLAHLDGTRALLSAWGAREALCLAGLFHSVYGTEMFGGAALPAALRDEARRRIGDEAERLAWLFGVLDRASFTRAVRGDGPALDRRSGAALAVTREELADLANLYVANAVEQVPRLPEICAIVERSLLEPCVGLLLPGAATALAAMAP